MKKQNIFIFLALLLLSSCSTLPTFNNSSSIESDSNEADSAETSSSENNDSKDELDSSENSSEINSSEDSSSEQNSSESSSSENNNSSENNSSEDNSSENNSSEESSSEDNSSESGSSEDLPPHIGPYNPIEGAKYYTDASKYYMGIDPSLRGLKLVEALSTLTSEGFVGHSYSSLPQIYKDSDLSNGKMRMMYTGTEKDFVPGSLPGSTNKEHVWPASWYGLGNREQGEGTPGSDAHNVWPCNTSLNSKRGSCAFDELDFGSATKCSEYGTYNYGDGSDDSYVWSTAGGNSNGQNTDAMYPAKGHRGETARILMYVATRYHNSRFPVMLHDQAVTLKIGRIGKLSTLLKWHYQEPPTQWEIRRNNKVAELWHHNRNPFVDHPEYATLIYSTLPEPDQSQPTDAVKNVINKYGRINYADPESITINNKDIALTKGGYDKISAKILPLEAKQEFTFTSLDTTIATVDGNGNVHGEAIGETKIKVESKVNPSLFDYVNIKVKDIVRIELKGTPTKLQYEEGESFNPDGLNVLACFNDGTSTTISNNQVIWVDGVTNEQLLSQGTTSIKAIYNDFEATFEGITVTKRLITGYHKVQEKLEDYSGRYLIVAEGAGVILNGDASSYSSSNGNIQTSVNIENDMIDIDAPNITENKEFLITKVVGGYKITSAGKHLTIGAHSNKGFDTDDSYVNEIEYDSSSNSFNITCNNLTLTYNTAGGDFKYYKSFTDLTISLYRLG